MPKLKLYIINTLFLLIVALALFVFYGSSKDIVGSEETQLNKESLNGTIDEDNKQVEADDTENQITEVDLDKKNQVLSSIEEDKKVDEKVIELKEDNKPKAEVTTKDSIETNNKNNSQVDKEKTVKQTEEPEEVEEGLLGKDLRDDPDYIAELKKIYTEEDIERLDAPRKWVTMPDVVGLTEVDAISTMNALGLVGRVAYEDHGKKEGTVIRQDTPPGRDQNTDASVIIWIQPMSKKVETTKTQEQSEVEKEVPLKDLHITSFAIHTENQNDVVFKGTGSPGAWVYIYAIYNKGFKESNNHFYFDKVPFEGDYFYKVRIDDNGEFTFPAPENSIQRVEDGQIIAEFATSYDYKTKEIKWTKVELVKDTKLYINGPRFDSQISEMPRDEITFKFGIEPKVKGKVVITQGDKIVTKDFTSDPKIHSFVFIDVDLSTFDNKPWVITIEAKDQHGNRSTVTRRMEYFNE